MTLGDVVTVVLVGAIGALGGALLAGPFGLVAGVVIGTSAAALATRSRIRPVVTVVVAGGTAGGALAGDGIVETLCFPGTCPALATTASILTAIGALIGVGLVMALVVRSFDEHREAVANQQPPPEPGCETDSPDGQ